MATMNDEKTGQEPPEKPQSASGGPAATPESPRVVKSASDTTAKPKRPTAKPAVESPRRAAVAAVESPVETPVETPARRSVETPVETPKDFVDDAFSVFGWGN